MDSALDIGARCASHPEREAERSCARCGSFFCAECRSESLPAHCVECAQRLEQRGRVGHVPALGITMMVHGVLTAGVGVYYLAFGGFFLFALRDTNEPVPTDGLFSGVMLGVMGVIGGAHVVPGLLQIVAGWRVRVYAARRVAIGSLGAGLVTLLGCYCAPTSVALLVWGLVVLLNDDVVARFAASRDSGR